MKYILSYGGGVNSTAMLFLILEKGLPLDEVIFADTGAEQPETYDYVPLVGKFCEEQGVRFTTLRAVVNTKEGESFSNIRDYCEFKRIIPFRKFRSCTDKFKIVPIHKHLREYDCDIVVYIGFDYGEYHRKRPSKVKWIENSYPLIDNLIGREGCKEIIERNGFPVPVKSGCYICPFQKLSDWKKLREDHPDLFADAMMLEEQAKERNSEALFTLRPLRMIDTATKEQRQIMEYLKEPCEHGWCMT